MDELSAVLCLRRRGTAAAQRREPRDDLSLRPVPRRGRQDGDAGPAERARVGGVLREGAAATGARSRPALHQQLEAQRGTRRAAPHDHRGRRALERGARRMSDTTESTHESLAVTAPFSYLFVPGNRPDRFDKALSSGADAIVIDLEDAVAANDKALAREHIGAWLNAQSDVGERVL